MPGDVIGHEGGNEEVGVIVAVTHVELSAECQLSRRLPQAAMAADHRPESRRPCPDRPAIPARGIRPRSSATAVVGAPSRLVAAEIFLEVPGATSQRPSAWLSGRKRRNGFEPAGVFQRQSDRAVAAHGVAENTLALHIDWESWLRSVSGSSSAI